MLGLRLIYLYPWKDYEKEFSRKSPEQLREYVRQRLETINKKERIWIVIIAGIGFLADAYAIFAINLVIPMLEIVYWQGSMPQNIQIGLTTATLGGSMLGQLFFGIAADRLGRRRMYGWELIVTIVATIGVASASSGISGIVPNSMTFQAHGTYPSDGAFNATGQFFAFENYTANGVDPWNGSLSIIGGLIGWRVVLGLAIGADYPLSAVICSEFAPKKNRAHMLSAVFFCQPLGQLTATLVALIVTAGYRSTLSSYDRAHCYQYPNCLRTVDIMWRIIIGLGALLPAVALGFRFAILESPRYTVDVLKKGVKAAAQLNSMGKDPSIQNNTTSGVFITPLRKNDFGAQLPVNEATPDASGAEETQEESRGMGDDRIRQDPKNQYHVITPSDGHVTQSVTANDENTVAKPEVVVSEQEEIQQERSRQKEKSSLHNSLGADIKRYFGHQGHKWTLFATSLCWFCLDLPFYGLGMNSTSIISQIWADRVDNTPNETDLYTMLLSNTWQSLIFVSVGALTGGLITFFSIDRLGERNIQIIGFSALFALFLLTGGLLQTQMYAIQDKPIIFLYVMCQVFFNFGPNTTTYIIPAEFFATRYRASCHGISAASGKLGSVIAQALIYAIYVKRPSYDIQDWLGWTLIGFSPFMLVGLMATIFLIPPTRGPDGKPLSLEQLAAEHERPKSKLEQIRKRKPKAVAVGNGAQDGESGGHMLETFAIEQRGVVFERPAESGRHNPGQINRRGDASEAVDQTA